MYTNLVDFFYLLVKVFLVIEQRLQLRTFSR